MAIYQTDLAYIHHVGFSDGARIIAPWLADQLQTRRIRRGLVVDLGCGSGVLAAELVRRRYDVLGVDVSPAMIALARRTAPGARFLTGSLFHTPLPSCHAVTALGEAVNYATGGSGLRRLLQRVFRALEPGGILVFDFVQGPVTSQLAPTQRHLQGPDWAVLIETNKRSTFGLQRRITLFRKVGRGFRRSEEAHELRLYDRLRVVKTLREIGFRVRTLRTLGAAELLPSRVGILARKPA